MNPTSTARFDQIAWALSVAFLGLFAPAAQAQNAAAPVKAASAPTKKVTTAPVIRRSVAADVVTTTAKPAKPTEPLLTKDELRACITEKPQNDAAAKQILTDQAQFQKDYDQIKAEQTAVNKENEANKALSQQISKERNELLLAVNDAAPAMPSTPDTTTTIALRAEAAAQAQLARAKAVDAKVFAFNSAQQGIRERAKAVDDRVPAINNQSKTLNARVEAQQALVDGWNKRCSAKLFDELDEIAIKKELASAKP